MKIFYDQDGKVIGSVDGPEAEAVADIGGLPSVDVPQGIKLDVLNPTHPLTVSDLTVVDGEIVVSEPTDTPVDPIL